MATDPKIDEKQGKRDTEGRGQMKMRGNVKRMNLGKNQ
jgi:hypothetical protein